MIEETKQDQSVEIENLDTEVQDLCGELTGTIEAARDVLLDRREAAFAAAIEPLESEQAQLRQENAAIETTARDLESLLPARARQAQRQHDDLLLSGQIEAAQVKLEEQKEAEAAPAAMRQRQQEIANRIAGLEEQKRNVARRVFEAHYAECQTVHRAIETGHFIAFLDALRDSFLTFEVQTCPPRSVQDQMVRQGHIVDLTAPENSPEWNSAARWYGGRRRR